MSAGAGAWALVSQTYERATAYLVFLLSRLVSLVVGRDEDRWIFGSFVGHPQFSNNAKYLYLHLAQNHPEARPIWITDSQQVHDTLEKAGYEVAMRWSLKARYHALRARFVALDSGLGGVPIEYTGGAVKVQLTHGIPLKGPRRWADPPDPARAENEGPLGRLLQRLDRAIYRVDYFCVPSKAGAEQVARWVRASRYSGHFERSFPSSTLLVSGFPRTDIFHRPVRDAELGNPPELREKLEDLDAFDAVIGYFPTFRDGREAIDPFDAEELEAFLADHNAILLVKSHHGMGISVPADSSRVRLLPPEADSSTFLQEIDVMVTDYSSLYFDYLHTGNPIILYTFDRAEYEQARGLLDNFDEITTAAIHRDTFEALLATLESLCEGDLANPLAQEAERFCDGFFLHRDGKAAQRIAAALTGRDDVEAPPRLSADAVSRELVAAERAAGDGPGPEDPGA